MSSIFVNIISFSSSSENNFGHWIQLPPQKKIIYFSSPHMRMHKHKYTYSKIKLSALFQYSILYVDKEHTNQL